MQYTAELAAHNLMNTRYGLPRRPRNPLEVRILGLKAMDRLNENLENLHHSIRAVEHTLS